MSDVLSKQGEIPQKNDGKTDLLLSIVVFSSQLLNSFDVRAIETDVTVLWSCTFQAMYNDVAEPPPTNFVLFYLFLSQELKPSEFPPLPKVWTPLQ